MPFVLQIVALAYGSAGVVGKSYDSISTVHRAYMDVFTAFFGSEF
jgi:hypothetical protein